MAKANRLSLTHLLLLLLVVALLSACAGQHTTKIGFISSYDGMRPTKDHPSDLIYIDLAYEAAKYQQVIIDPVAWMPAPNTPKRDLEVIEQLKADFRKSLSETLTKYYAVVDLSAARATPGISVLRVRSAITNTRRANWWINGPVQVVGIVGVIFGVPGVPPPDPGGASEELEVIDVQTGRRVAAIATYNNGKPWNLLGFYERFGHARSWLSQRQANCCLMSSILNRLSNDLALLIAAPVTRSRPMTAIQPVPPSDWLEING